MDPPSTPPRKRLTRDQRRDVLLMRSLKYTYEQIAVHLGISQRAVQYTCQKETATPQHARTGRPPRLSKDEADRVEEYVTSTSKTRRMTYLQVAEALWPEGEVGVDTVRNTLRRRGYARRVALRKPPLSDQNKALRLEWARTHADWTIKQWNTIIWSDETWVTAGNHRKTYVTRKPGEELDPTCIIPRIQRQSGWMFWGCFYADIKGPYVFWEKDWGSINKDTYTERIVPIIDGYIRLLAREENGAYTNLVFMQDNAPGHAARVTMQELEERGIHVIKWVPFSPDLNPIEALWNKMKNWIALHYPNRYATYDQLRIQVIEAWGAIGKDTLRGLINTMQQRCLDVIAAEGGHTKW